jgi:hypothetical protein
MSGMVAAPSHGGRSRLSVTDSGQIWTVMTAAEALSVTKSREIWAKSPAYAQRVFADDGSPPHDTPEREISTLNVDIGWLSIHMCHEHRSALRIRRVPERDALRCLNPMSESTERHVASTGARSGEETYAHRTSFRTDH